MRTIHIIEDDDTIRDTLKDVLELEGYLVQTSVNGKEALDTLIQSKLPNLILLDLMMPVMSGWEFEARKQHPHLLQIPIILTSAVADPSALRKEVDSILKKPIDLDLLLSTISKHCGDPYSSQSPDAP